MNKPSINEYSFGYPVHFHVLMTFGSMSHEDFDPDHTDTTQGDTPEYEVHFFADRMYEPEWQPMQTRHQEKGGLSKCEAISLAREMNLNSLVKTLPCDEVIVFLARIVEEYNRNGKVFDIIDALKGSAHHIEEERQATADHEVWLRCNERTVNNRTVDLAEKYKRSL